MINKHKHLLLTPLLVFLTGCSYLSNPIPLAANQIQLTPDPSPTVGVTQDVPQEAIRVQADILSVEVSGTPGSYHFSVGILSPDSGCEQYADWWEVLSEDGKLIYRRILLHSHVNEQPFSRSGGPIGIDPATVVIVRAHMNPAGYEGVSMKGSVNSGFSPADLPPDFAPGVEQEPPLPTGCNF
jgi:hypothetical protein